MPFVVVAIYRARPGLGPKIAEQLRGFAPSVRSEAGCLQYEVQRSIDDLDVLLLYEKYTDSEAYDAHVASRHFESVIVNVVIPMLQSRERSFYESL